MTDLQKLWEDPANWTLWSYRCAADPRVMVLKRNKLGWTVNAAHPKALAVTFTAAVIALAGPGAVIVLGGMPFDQRHFFLGILASASALAAFCLWCARKP